MTSVYSFVPGPIMPYGSDAEVWKKLQDVPLYHPLHRA